MKSSVFLLFALMASSYVSADSSDSDSDSDSYTRLCSQDVNGNDNITEILKFGIHDIFQKAARRIEFNGYSQIQVNRLYAVFKRTNDDRSYYKFDLEANNRGDATLNATFTVRTNPADTDPKMAYWNYHISVQNNNTGGIYQDSDDDDSSDDNEDTDIDGPDGSSYSDVDLNQYNSSRIQDVLITGAQYIINQEPQKIPEDNYHISEINSLQWASDSSSNSDSDDGFYKADVKVENDDGSTTIDMKFTLKWDDSDNDISDNTDNSTSSDTTDTDNDNDNDHDHDQNVHVKMLSYWFQITAQN